MPEPQVFVANADQVHFRHGLAQADSGTTYRDGSPMARHEVAFANRGDLFLPQRDRAAELLAKRQAFPASLAGPLAPLAAATLPARTAEEAVARAWRYARCWHAITDGAYLVPAPCPGARIAFGPAGGRFESEARARRHFHEHPNAVPIFILATDDYTTRYTWRPGVLSVLPELVRAGG